MAFDESFDGDDQPWRPALEAAFLDRDHPALARALTSMHTLGVPLIEAARWAVRWSFDHLEAGMSHAYVAMADWLALAEASPPDDLEARLICLTEALDHVAYERLRQPRFPYTATARAFEPAPFRAAIEAGDEPTACAMALGALVARRGLTSLAVDLSRAALNRPHDQGFGLVCVHKAVALAARLHDAQVERALLLALLRALTHTPALTPALTPYRASLERLEARGLGHAPGPVDAAGLRGAGLGSALTWTVEAAARWSPEAVFDALLEACARDLLAFDLRHQEAGGAPSAPTAGWPELARALTFAHAARQACRRDPALWPASLLQLACFHGRNTAFTGPVDDARWSVEAVDAFRQALRARLLDHGLGLPLYSALLVETACAVMREHDDPLTSPSCRRALLAGLHRFTRGPFKMRHPRRVVQQAMAALLPGRAT